MKFTNESLFEITDQLRTKLKTVNEHDILTFEVLNPDLFDSTYAGTKVVLENQEYIYRGLKAYSDLCELLNCKMLLPMQKSEKTVLMHFKKLKTKESFHLETDSTEKYGVNTHFAKIQKMKNQLFYSTIKKR